MKKILLSETKDFKNSETTIAKEISFLRQSVCQPGNQNSIKL
jgi:hypothetical protein